VRYGTAARETLCILCEVLDRVCFKRLKVMIPVPLPALFSTASVEDAAALQAQLAQVSPATYVNASKTLHLPEPLLGSTCEPLTRTRDLAC
jgi:hypothetical protein